VLFLAVLVSEVVWFASVPVDEGNWPPGSHPEERPLFGLVGTRSPEMLVSQTCKQKMSRVTAHKAIVKLIQVSK